MEGGGLGTRLRLFLVTDCSQELKALKVNLGLVRPTVKEVRRKGEIARSAERIGRHAGIRVVPAERRE